MKGLLQQEYERYIKDESWKCSASPAGAHHWVIRNSTQECRHCHEVRQVCICWDAYGAYKELKNANKNKRLQSSGHN